MKQTFIPLPVDRLVEVVVDISERGTYVLPEPHSLKGCRVKLVINVPEEWVENIDSSGIAHTFTAAGAIHVKTPDVRVLRKDIVRDERHHVELPLEESIRLFAEETQVTEADRRVEFAIALAREADNND